MSDKKYHEIVSECFRNYKEAILQQAKHPDDSNYDNWVIHTENKLEDAIEDMVRAQILKHIESYLKIELSL